MMLPLSASRHPARFLRLLAVKPQEAMRHRDGTRQAFALSTLLVALGLFIENTPSRTAFPYLPEKLVAVAWIAAPLIVAYWCGLLYVVMRLATFMCNRNDYNLMLWPAATKLSIIFLGLPILFQAIIVTLRYTLYSEAPDFGNALPSLGWLLHSGPILPFAQA